MLVVITLILPYPVSANDYWGTRIFKVKGRPTATVYVTDEARKYRRMVADIALAVGIRKPLPGRVSLHVQLYPHRPQDYLTRQRKLGAAWEDGGGDVSPVRCIDLDNANKVLLDALKDVVFQDDAWVRRLVSERMEPDADGARVVIHVEQLQVAQPQLALLGEAA